MHALRSNEAVRRGVGLCLHVAGVHQERNSASAQGVYSIIGIASTPPAYLQMFVPCSPPYLRML